MKDLVVILIIVHKEILTNNEKASLNQCYKILKNYPIKLISPLGLNMAEYKNVNSHIEVDYINPKWQKTYRMFNRLKIDRLLYRRYQKFKYILFYELDAWVFRDDLTYWCNRGFDYIGAPWLENSPNPKQSYKSLGVGNGGLSLRNVKSHLRVLNSFSYVERFGYFHYLLTAYPVSLKNMIYVLRHLTTKNNTFHLFNTFEGNEDGFWGIVAKRNFKWFKVAEWQIALQFSVEAMPSKFIKSSKDLPFGCHAWEKYEPEFWKQYIVNDKPAG